MTKTKTQRGEIINSLEGKYFIKNFWLCSDPKSFGEGGALLSFEKPIFIDKSNRIALGRAIHYKTRKLRESELKSKSDGVSLDESFYLHSYNMLWDEKTQQFNIKIVDNSDTGIWFINYSGKKNFNFQRIETSDISEGIQKPIIVDNTCICVHKAYKIDIEVDFPTYNSLYKIKKK
tara:strand:- start:101 stop:628 length:528 start_codon:yes stop_codon:yes gene_type:complete